MPTANSTHLSPAELELKRRGRRRLVGAITIGVIAIVVLPMVFDSEPKRKETARQEIEVKAPPKDGLPPLAAPVAPPSSSTAPSPAASPVAAVATTEAKPGEAIATPAKPVTPRAEPKAQDLKAGTTSKVDTPSVAPPDNASTPKGATVVKDGFVIQIGAFKDAENAKAVVARMKEAKLPVFTDAIPVKTGNVTRVRVGPFATKERAESALAQVKLAGVDGKVVSLP